MEAMVIDRAKARKHERAVLVTGGKSGALQEFFEVEALTFDEDTTDGRGAWEGDVAAICGKNQGGRRSIDGASAGLELAVEKLVKGLVGVWFFGEFRDIYPVFFEEGGNALA